MSLPSFDVTLHVYVQGVAGFVQPRLARWIIILQRLGVVLAWVDATMVALQSVGTPCERKLKTGLEDGTHTLTLLSAITTSTYSPSSQAAKKKSTNTTQKSKNEETEPLVSSNSFHDRGQWCRLSCEPVLTL